jgi:hypothetical protein
VCKTFLHSFDGHVFLEDRPKLGSTWVAKLECTVCGSRREDVMTPNTCQLLHRSYDWSEDYEQSLPRTAAKAELFQQLLVRR